MIEDEKRKPVRYGSVIYLSTGHKVNSFVFSDGFMDNRVILKAFEGIGADANGHHDFSFSLFMVLPFSNASCFDVQRQIIREWRDVLLNNSNKSLKLEDRKNIVLDLKNKLDSELQFNIGTLQKSQKTNICFGSSNFMLLHTNSLKYLCLNLNDDSSLSLELTEDPNDNSFFNFDPSLKLQKVRSDNFVYEEEIVHISCTEKQSGKNPFLCIRNHEREGLALDEDLIVGAIDGKENWKVNIYEEPLDDSSSQYMRIGSCVWILLSEKLQFLEAEREKDPFLELYEFQQLDKKKKIKHSKSSQKNEAPLSRLETLQSQEINLTDGFLGDPRKHLYDELRMKVVLREIKELSDKVGQTEELSSFGLWKIESLNEKRGGELRWEEQYRLKHLVSGLYLTVLQKPMDEHQPTTIDLKDQQKFQWVVALSSAKDDDTIFQFVPIDNLISYQNKPQTKGLIQKDAFYMIKNVIYDQYVGFFDKHEGEKHHTRSRGPVMYDYIKDVNTFRFKEASFSCVWENYSLVSSFPILFKIISNTMDTSKIAFDTTQKKETLIKQSTFDRCYKKTIYIMEFFVDFLLNKILSNINQDQEIMYPSDVRQSKFQQQFLLGLLCWMLGLMFPSFDEFDKTQISPHQESLKILNNPQLLKTIQNVLKKRKGVKYTKIASNSSQEHLLKKYNISCLIYKVLQAACYQNSDNQDFVFKFIQKLSDHIGYGEFVSESLQIIFRDNFKILHQIHREQFHQLNEQDQQINENIFQVITTRLKHFKPYRKTEIFQLLGSFTQIGKTSIYLNQEKVFSSIVENKSFLFGHQLKLICELETSIQVEFRIKQQKEFIQSKLEMVKFCVEFDKGDQVMMEYFKAQMRLYSLLCQNRNYACVKNMQELLPRKVLLLYLSKDKLKDEFKAIICSIMLNLYVDKEPRTIIHKPNYVRVFRQTTMMKEESFDISPLKCLNYFQLKKQKRVEVQNINDGDSKRQHRVKGDDQSARFIEINLSDDIIGAYEIRQWMLDYLKDITKKIIDYDKGAPDLMHIVYNHLTYEVIKTLCMMVEYGLFTQYATKLMEDAVNDQRQLPRHTFQQSDETNHLEQLIKLIAYLLEFDQNYFRELHEHDFKRTYVQQQQKKSSPTIDLFNLDLLLELVTQSEEEKEEEEEIKKKQDQQDEYQNHQFLKRYQSLLRIIQKFTNKTFTNEEFKIEVQDDYQVLIKKEICQIFNNLLDWRSDQFMENTIQYFQDIFYDYYKENKEIAITQFDNESLKELMPDLFLNPGEAANNKETKSFQLEEVRNLDVVLNRPFVEILLLAFYFSQNPGLQNSIANLIFKIYSQRDKLLLNIQKVSLVQPDSDQQNSKLSSLLNKLKGLISYSQNWLQIIEQNDYDEKAEQILIHTQKVLTKVVKVFEEHFDNPEMFIIKQKIFKHLAGHKLIMKFINQGTTVIDSRIEYFKDDQDTTKYSYKNQFIKNIKNTFVLSHQILSSFAEDNQSNQRQLYKHYGKMLINEFNINIGQVEFMKDLFANNLQLCSKPQVLYFNFIVNLIKDHGHYHQFIEVFYVFLDSAGEKKDDVLIQKQIIQTLFNEDVVAAVNPFFKHETQIEARRFPQFYTEPPNELFYITAFIECVCNCLRSDIGVNFIIKVNNQINVITLLELLLKFTNIQINSMNYNILANICEILHVFFDKLDCAIDQFRDGAQLFIKLLDLQIIKLKSKTVLNHDEYHFLCIHVVGLVNTYFDHYLKEVGMIALKLLSNDKAVQKEKKVFEFAQVLTDNIDRLTLVIYDQDSAKQSSFQLIKNMAKLYKNFNIPNNKKFPQLKDTISKEQYYDGIHIVNNKLEQNFDKPLNNPHKLIQEKTKLIGVITKVKLSNKFQLQKTTLQKQKVHQPTDLEQYWQAFVKTLVGSKNLKESIKEESLKFPYVMKKVSAMFEGKDDERQKEMLISEDDIITKLLQYTQYWKSRQANKNTIIFVLKSIRLLVSVNKDQTEKQKTDQQNHLDGLNATSIVLRLFWKDKSTDDEYVYQLIKFIIELLDGGNKTIQMSILTLFKTNQDSEAFFRKIFNVLSDEMNSIKTNARKVQSNKILQVQLKQRKFIEKTLRVIQLLCEGHNNFLQDYLRQQTNSKISYDLVSLMVKLVISQKISNQTYESVLQCLETLTEVVQGPCKENQMVIVTSKFIEWAIDLLREDEKLFEIKMITQSADQNSGQGTLAIHRGLLMRLKYKCSVTLLSLLEMQEENEEIVSRMIRSIPCSVLANELTRVHGIFTTVFKKDYVKEAFARYLSKLDINKKSTEEDELIIEYGFNLFILVNILILKNKKEQEDEIDDIQQLIEEYQFVKEKDEDDLLGSLKVLGDLSSIGQSFLANSLDAIKIIAQGDEQLAQQSELAQERERRKMQKEAFIFFSHNTAFIEVIRDKAIIRMYFPLMPHCQNLPKDTRQQFHEGLDHSSTRDKLTHLMRKADHMIEVLNHEEDLRRIFKNSKILELFVKNKALWENLAFIANIVINFTIVASYSQYVYTNPIPTRDTPEQEQVIQQSYTSYTAEQWNPTELQYARLYDPRFLSNMNYTFTSTMIQVMGLLTLALSSLVIFFFFIKRAPLLLKKMWINFFAHRGTCYSKFVLFLKTVVKSLIACCTDFQFVYYTFFMTCNVLGLLVHPFIFTFLLVDFLRISTLKIVVKSIWISKGPMILTFLVFLLVQYYFTIIAYIYLPDQYVDGGALCDRVWECFLINFDQTFKNGGAIGEYLVDPERLTDSLQYPTHQLPINYIRTANQQLRFVMRVIFDDLFMFILKIIIINMVAGIIIDTFGALKDAMLETEKNLTEFCFVCGIEREKLDKSLPYGYNSHIVKDHNMWNYVFYKAYLIEKSQTEFSGNETYIKRQLANTDIDWFPVKRFNMAIGFIDDDEEDDDTEKIELTQQIYNELTDVESLAFKAVQKAKDSNEKS